MMALQIIVKNVVHHEAAPFVGAESLVQRWLATGGRRLHEIDVGEDGREPMPELSGVAIADQELISLLGVLAEAHGRIKG